MFVIFLTVFILICAFAICAFAIYAFGHRGYPTAQSLKLHSTSSTKPSGASQPLRPEQTQINNRAKHKQARLASDQSDLPEGPSSLPAYSTQTKNLILTRHPQLAALRKTHEKQVDEFLMAKYSKPDALYDYNAAVRALNGRIQAHQQLSEWLTDLYRGEETVSGIFQIGRIGHVLAYHYVPEKGIQVHNYTKPTSKAAPNQAQPYVVPSQTQAIEFTSNIPAQCYPIIQKLFDASGALKVNADITHQVLPASDLLDDIKASADKNDTRTDKWIPTMQKALHAIGPSDPPLVTSYDQGALGDCMYYQACPYMSLFIASLMAANLDPKDYYMPKDLETALMDVLFGYQISMMYVQDQVPNDESNRILYDKMDYEKAYHHVFESFLGNPEQLQHKNSQELQQELTKFISLHPNINFTLDEQRKSNIKKLFACENFHAVLTNFNCKKKPATRLSIFERHPQQGSEASSQWQ